MWPFRKKQGRRREAARSRAEGRAEPWRRLREAGAAPALVIALLFAIAAGGVILLGGRTVPHHVGELLWQPYVARVAFDGPTLDDPPRTVHHAKGEPLVRAGAIDERELALIEAEQGAFLASGQAGRFVFYAAGIGILVLLTSAALAIYTARYEPRIVRNRVRAAALAALLAAALLGGRLIVLFAWKGAWLYLAALTIALLVVMVLTIAYNQRFALGAGWMFSLLLTMALGLDFPFLLVLLTAVTVATMALDSVRSRSKLVAVGVFSGVGAAAAMLATGLVGAEAGLELLRSVAAAAAAGLAAGLIIQGLLPGIERVFDIATAMTLLEYSDASKPLPRRLAADCPGTFNHSLLLGTMAEAAADAIGADGLLARVGAYYHDIGKINKPGYFVENQEGAFSRHAKLSPAMSLLIILGHVKDGVELAREYNLPRVIWPFITEHHGTTLVAYFYHAAARQSGEAEPPPETQYRYPGPKPQSKETAILMLCDSVEGAVRALPEPTAGRIEDVVHQIARKRLEDGQLDECNLTLRELHAVEQSLVKSLCSFYHGRIAYPSAVKENGKAEAAKENGKTEAAPAEDAPPAVPSTEDRSPEVRA